MQRSADMEQNLKVIPLHEAAAASFVWIPIFVLFTRARFDLDGAILLASLYYLFVVVIEVPSGWLSDRYGRVLTLRLAAVSWTVAHLCFLLGDDRFAVILVGQFLMATGFASLSGTAVSFHYDTLEALDRAHEFEVRQARVAAIGFVATSAAVLAGGALGLVSLRAPFAVAAALALAQLATTLTMTEPPQRVAARDREPQLRTCLAYLRSRPVAWLFLYGVALVTLEHVSVSLLQPWLTEALDQTADDLGSTPLVSGLTFGAMAILGAGAARASAPLSARFGPATTLVGLALLSGVIITVMAAWAHPAALIVVVLRSAQSAAAPVVLAAAVAPRIQQHHRATFLSINSLAGRLGYGLILLALAGAGDDDLTATLTILAVISWAVIAAIVALLPVLWTPRQTH